ncbi:cache domain-containing sensor histidine kinase [Paenibacillus chitinolyticus]|uniref:cache domain-containing sensor histidine kinase n=1 Tax=Paenibacillus chitinolyticus TaxID=79263 RepID=UPI003644B6AB
MPSLKTFYRIHLKKRMFNKILLFYSIVMVLLFMGVSILAYQYYEQRSVREQTDRVLKDLDIVSVNLNQLYERMYSAIQQLYTDAAVNEDLTYFLSHEYEDYLKRRLNQYIRSSGTEPKNFDSQLRSFLKDEPSIANILLYSKGERFFYFMNPRTQRFYYPSEIPQDSPGWFDSIINHQWLPTDQRSILWEARKDSGPVYSYTHVLKDTVSLQKYGAIVFDLNTDEIKRLVESKLKDRGAKMLLMTSGGQVIYDSENRYQGQIYPYWHQLQEQQDWVELEEPSKVNVLTIGNTGMTIAGIIPKSRIEQSMDTIRLSLIGITALCIAVSFMFTFTIIRQYSKKIRKIVTHIRRLQEGDLSARIVLTGEDELQDISQNFNYMCDRLETYIDQVYRSEIKQKNAELVAMQAQINPHFLYNTLESIRMKAITSGARDVGQMIYILAALFRDMIRKQTNVTLAEEMEMNVMYLKLFQYRFENRLEVETHLDKNAANCQVVKLLIQPVVENYLVHGFRPESDSNRIAVSMTREEENIVVRVADNGKGMPPERLAEIRKRLAMKPDSGGLGGDSLGLVNVNERIRSHYGSDYGLAIDSGPDQGCEVMLKLPAIQGEMLP